MEGRLQGKVCVITGIGSGMGRAGAIRFAAEGAKVVECDILPERGRATADEIVRAGGNISFYDEDCDLSDPTSASAFADYSSSAYGGVDVLWNNAARIHGDWVDKMSIEAWRRCIAEELDLVFYLTQAIWPHLVSRCGGSIINTASTSGYVGTSIHPSLAHSTAKAGVLGFTRALAIEGGKHKIRINSVSPGPVLTPQSLKEVGGDMFEKRLMPRMLLGRLGKPDDIVNYALFLASDESSWITGTDLNVDGGFLVAG